MNLVARFLILMVLVSIGGEFVAPLIAPAHASCTAQMPEPATESVTSVGSAASSSTATLATPDAHRDCHHHSPFCELPGHGHSGHCGPIASFRFQVVPSSLATRHLVTDDTLPSSPHLSAFKRPPIAA